MTGAKRKPERLPVPERVRRAFAAATGDLQPRGKLPAGMTDEQAGRALLAFAGIQLERFAVAAEKMRAILEESDDPLDDWPNGPDDEAEPERSAPEEPGSVPQMPAGFIPGNATPEQVAGLLREQDLETCRRFAVELLVWMMDRVEERGGVLWDLEELHDLHRDMAAQEAGAVDVVAACFDRSRRPRLEKADGTTVVAPQLDDDQADDDQADEEAGDDGPAT